MLSVTSKPFMMKPFMLNDTNKPLMLRDYLLCGIMLSVVILSVIMLSVVIMNVVAPSEHVRLKAESRDCRGSHSILQNFYGRK
jgi:hypothetical protein